MTSRIIDLLPSAVYTASSQSSQFAVPTISMAAVVVDITLVDGTTPKFTAFLQGSPDSGVTWFDFPYDLRAALSTSATDVTATANKRNITDEAAAVGKFLAVYKHLPVDLVRLKYIVSGASPEFTARAWLIGK